MPANAPPTRPVRWSLTFLLGLSLGLPACGSGGGGGGTGGTGGTQLLDAAVGGVPVVVLPDEGPPPAPPACADGIDNDGDGLIDRDDPGCEDRVDNDETDNAPPACANGLDDDGDGTIDLADRGCGSPRDTDESDDPPAVQCANATDDDGDGYTDFPADPGCASPDDDDEINDTASLPECADGEDNDRDGLIDLADPGCTSPADPREADPDGDRPQCSNQLDDDADGIVDFPLDPGCQAAGDNDEAETGVTPQCGNARDDDGDGRVDYPDDPGCAGVGDHDEADPPVTPACSDGVDNDRDGAIDYPEDDGCESAGDTNEAGSCGDRYTPGEIGDGEEVHVDTSRGRFLSEGTCGGRGAPEVVFVHRVARTLEKLVIRTDLDGTTAETTLYARRGCLDAATEVGCAREPVNDGVVGNRLEIPAAAPGDYYIFVDGAGARGGPVSLVVEEVPLAACLNHLDDDGDGRIDFPVDPGCDSPDDRDEADPATPPACADDEDNDHDGLVDYPIDQGCRSAADNDETDLCGQGVRTQEYPVGQDSILDDLSMGATNNFAGSCGGANQPEKVFLYANPINARLSISVDNDDTLPNTIVYVRQTCLGGELPSACNSGIAPNQRGHIRIDQAPPGDYYIFVDRLVAPGGPFRLSVTAERLPAGCADNRDNDADGTIDAEDIGCSGVEDEDERNDDAAPLPACADAVDNDADGLVDYPYDPGCAYHGGDSEADPPAPPACGNGRDDDADGATDFPADPGCSAAGDVDEANPRVAPQCSNRLDDDQDGKTDYPADPGCVAAGDPTERDPDPLPACFNRVDDDRDGLTDFPFNPGCVAAGDPDEANPEDPAQLPACSNTVDDDGDGRIDFPREPGCVSAGDDDETDPAALPQCANGRDDDGDGRVDYPDDTGCFASADNGEIDDGPPLPRCSDGRDNDDDGQTDTRDPGCQNARDDDETDEAPAELPFCADGIDNDGDGSIDWPDDNGCAARGDFCEEDGYGRCNGVCQDITNDAQNCGRCGRACAAGVECVEGRCGGIRQIVMVCGGSSRSAQEFIRGPLADLGVVVQDGCVPNDQTQAILLTRGGNVANAATMRQFINDGGQVLTEYNVSHTFYNAIFGANIPQGARNGGCQDNVQPAFQFSPQDQFWIDNQFVPVPNNATGCGYSVVGDQVPGFVPLGGWDANNVGLGYVEEGAGRYWFIESDWQDSEPAFTDTSRDLMAYMIGGGSVPIQ